MNLFGPPCHVLPSYRYENHARSHWILHEALVANRGSISNLGTHAENTENTVAEGFFLTGKKAPPLIVELGFVPDWVKRVRRQVEYDYNPVSGWRRRP